MEDKILKTIKDHHLIDRGDRILIGVSGGADSLALLTVLIHLRKQLECELAVAHLHHDMRGAAADEDAAFVRAYCFQNEITFYFEKNNVLALARSEGIGIEVAGRQARYKFFNRIMKEAGYNKLALAHHMNDQAETLLFRLIRGTGITGASAIRYQEGPVIRPMLKVSRKEIEDYCQSHRLAFCHDATNDDDRLFRNFLRHQVIPQLEQMNPASVRHFSDFCDRVQEASSFIDLQVTDAAKQLFHFQDKPKKAIEIKLMDFEPLQPFLKGEVLRRALGTIGETMVDVESRHIREILTMLDSERTVWSLDLPHEICVSREYDQLVIAQGRPEVHRLEPVKISIEEPGTYEIGRLVFHTQIGLSSELKNFQNCKKLSTFVISCGRIYSDFLLRTRQPGDRIKLSGMTGHRSVKKMFIDRKIPAYLRNEWPILAMGEQVLWIPGIAVAEGWIPTDSEEKVIIITLENINER